MSPSSTREMVRFFSGIDPNNREDVEELVCSFIGW
jgi:hypothetical protein